MDMMAGVGGMMGQLAVGIAGGDQTGAVMMASKMQMMKSSNIDSLPDKVGYLKISIDKREKIRHIGFITCNKKFSKL